MQNQNKSFETIIKRISPTLKRITYKLNGHFTFFNEEDLFQESMVHLWEDFNAGKLDDKTDSYILQGCYFHLKNYIRIVKPWIRQVSIEALVNDEETALKDTLCLQDEGSKRYFGLLNDKLLAETIQNNGLTRKEKHILLLCAGGRTTREIGAELGISHVMVVKQMARIREKCRKYLDNP